jgi:hypothetical protein
MQGCAQLQTGLKEMQILGHLNADSPKQQQEGEAEGQNMPARLLSPQGYSFCKKEEWNMLIILSVTKTLK